MGLATLYVDVENLQDIARKAITATIEQWPTDSPKIDTLQLYVRADQTQLWHIWASHKFPSIKLSVKGVQRYGAVSKNLADMSLILDAFADLLKGRTAHVAVLSDDSDFVVLFAAIKQEIHGDNSGGVPFVWFLTDRPDTHTLALNDFLPSGYLHTITCAEPKKLIVVKANKKVVDDNRQSGEDLIAKAIIQNIPVGSFKSADCMKIVKRDFPEHNLAKVDSPTFGTQFARNIFPKLEKYGVRLPNPDKKPRKYEMTEDAKKSVAIK